MLVRARERKAGDAGDTGGPRHATLSDRAHGMPESTLRRHLAALVRAGIILRHDSPNGKRYARRGEGGEITDAYGFDLTPLVARAVPSTTNSTPPCWRRRRRRASI